MQQPRLGESDALQLLKRHEFSLFLAIMLVIVLTTLLDSNHNYWNNPSGSIKDITRQTTYLGIFSLGAAIVIIAGGIDLSSGSVIAFSGTICATFLLLLAPERMTSGGQLPLGTATIAIAVLGTLVVGFLIGSLHAWLITAVGLPPFVATLATLVGLRSFARAICENVTESITGSSSTQINISDDWFRDVTTTVWIAALVFLGLAALTWLIMSRTVIGRHLYALGGNEEAARLSGIRTDRLKWFAYSVSAVFSSIAGILYIGDQSVAEPQTLGRGYELNAIAAAVVGGCSLQGGIGTIPGTVLGALFLRVVIDGVSKIIKTGADVYEGLIVGVVVVFAVAFSQLDGLSHRRSFFSGGLGWVAVVNLSILSGAMAALVGPTLIASEASLEAGPFAALVGLATFSLLVVVRSGLTRTWKLRVTAGLAVLVVAAFIGLDYSMPQYRHFSATRTVERLGGDVEQTGEGAVVDLSQLDISDVELERLVSRLKDIHDLVELRLAGTGIGDDGLDSLASLSTLRKLDVSGTEVTAGGIRRLGRELPELEVVQ